MFTQKALVRFHLFKIKIFEDIVRSTDLFLNIDVQVECRNRDLKKHLKIFSSDSILIPTIIYMNIYSKLYKILSENLTKVLC